MFLLFGFPLWILIVELILFAAWTILVQIEFYGWSTFAFLVNVGALYLFMRLPIAGYFKEHPGTIGILLVLSLCCGFVWAIFMKWPSFLYKFKEVREERLDAYREGKKNEARRRAARQAESDNNLARENAIRVGRGEPPRERPIIKYEDDKTELKEPDTEFNFLNREFYKDTRLSKSPQYKEYKGKIAAWVIFWFPSLIGTLLDDFVRRMVTWILNRFSQRSHNDGLEFLRAWIDGHFGKLELDSPTLFKIKQMIDAIGSKMRRRNSIDNY